MLKPGLDYQHLDPATSPELMKPLLQGELSNAWSRDVRIGEFSFRECYLGRMAAF